MNDASCNSSTEVFGAGEGLFVLAGGVFKVELDLLHTEILRNQDL